MAFVNLKFKKLKNTQKPVKLNFGESTPNPGTGVVGQLDTTINSPLLFEGVGHIQERPVNKGYLDATITGLTFTGHGHYSNDTFRGLYSDVEVSWQHTQESREKIIVSRYQQATHRYTDLGVKFNLKAGRLVDRTTSRFTDGVRLRNALVVPYAWGVPLGVSLLSPYTQLLKIRGAVEGLWSAGIPMFKAYGVRYQVMIKLAIVRSIDWEGASTIARGYSSSFTKASPFSLSHTIPWGAAIKPWYGKSPIPPPPPPPKYEGSTTLNFVCRYIERDPRKVILNFSKRRCNPLTAIRPKGCYIVMNKLTVRRVADNKPINPYKVSISTDKASWCWSFSMVISGAEAKFIEPVDGELPIIEVVLNNIVFRFLAERKKRNRSWNNHAYTVTGRSVSAILDDVPRSYTQSISQDAIQAVLGELGRVTSLEFGLDWSLVSDTGWSIPANSLTYSEKTPIQAIAEIVTPAQGIIITHPWQPQLIIKPKYPYAYWETPTASKTLVEQAMEQESMEWIPNRLYNAVFVYSENVNFMGRIVRQGTNGDTPAPQLVAPLLTTSTAMASAGKSILGSSGSYTKAGYTMPLMPEIGLFMPCDVVTMQTVAEGDWWGTVDNVSLEVNVANNGVITIDQAITIDRYLGTDNYV